MSNLIDENGNEIGHPEQFDMSIYKEKIKCSNTLDDLYETVLNLEKENKKLKKMKCCGNCCFAIHSRLDGTFCGRKAEYRQANEKCNDWELAE